MEPYETDTDSLGERISIQTTIPPNITKTKDIGLMLIGASIAVFIIALIQSIIGQMPGALRNEPFAWGMMLLFVWSISLGLCLHLLLSENMRMVPLELRKTALLRLAWAFWIGLVTLTLAWWGSGSPDSLSIASSLITVSVGIILYLYSVGAIKRRKPADLFP